QRTMCANSSKSAPMITLDGYVVTDEFFGEPYVDVDEDRDAPLRHRYLHGGFVGTDTRFSFYFPTDGWQGRMLNPLQGGFGGSEHHFRSPAGEGTRAAGVSAL